MSDSLIKALELAVSHIEHMAAWIGEQRRGYSFESLGEDMPGIKAALSASTDAAPIAWMLRAERASHTRSARQYGDRRVLCGQVFMSEKTAGAAAERQSNRWRKVEAFPVYDLAAPSQQAAHDAAIEAAARVAESFDQPRLTAYYRKKLYAIASAIRALSKRA